MGQDDGPYGQGTGTTERNDLDEIKVKRNVVWINTDKEKESVLKGIHLVT